MVESKVVSVTPKMASEWLAISNINNRRLRKAVVTRYARDMKNGRWEITGDAISFDENGILLNGQHRLSAVIESNTTIEMMVTTGLNKSAAVGIDQGLKRSLQDNLKMTTGSLPEAFATGKIPSAIRTLIAIELNMTLSNNEVMFVYEKFKSEFDTLDRILHGKRKNAPMTKEFYAAAAAALIYGESSIAIDDFLLTYCNYENNLDFNIQSALNWRNYIDNAKVHKTSVSRVVVYRGTQQAIYNYIHTEVKMIRVPKEEKYDIRNKLIEAIQGDDDVSDIT